MPLQPSRPTAIRPKQIFADYFDTYSGWTAKAGTWSVASSQLQCTTNTNNAYIARAFPNSRTYTSVNAFLYSVVSPDNVDNGMGPMLFTSSALVIGASINIYARPNGWRVRVNNADVTSGTRSNGSPITYVYIICIPGYQLYYVNGVQVYVGTTANLTYYGVGVHVNLGATTYKAGDLAVGQ